MLGNVKYYVRVVELNVKLDTGIHLEVLLYLLERRRRKRTIGTFQTQIYHQ